MRGQIGFALLQGIDTTGVAIGDPFKVVHTPLNIVAGDLALGRVLGALGSSRDGGPTLQVSLPHGNAGPSLSAFFLHRDALHS